jgi:anti-sigma factor RsiW
VEYRRSLGAYLLGALEPDEEARLEAHVRRCAACHAELLKLGSVVADLAVLAHEKDPEPPPGGPGSPATP